MMVFLFASLCLYVNAATPDQGMDLLNAEGDCSAVNVTFAIPNCAVEEGCESCLPQQARFGANAYERNVQVAKSVDSHEIFVSMSSLESRAELKASISNKVVWDYNPSKLAEIRYTHSEAPGRILQIYTKLRFTAEPSSGVLSVLENGRTCIERFVSKPAPSTKQDAPSVCADYRGESCFFQSHFHIFCRHCVDAVIPLTQDDVLTVGIREDLRDIWLVLNEENLLPSSASSFNNYCMPTMAGGAKAALFSLALTPHGQRCAQTTSIFTRRSAQFVIAEISTCDDEVITVCARKSTGWTLPEHCLATCTYKVTNPTPQENIIRVLGKKSDSPDGIYTVLCLNETTKEECVITRFKPKKESTAGVFSFLSKEKICDHLGRDCGICEIELSPDDVISIDVRACVLSMRFKKVEFYRITYNKSTDRLSGKRIV